MTPPTDPSYTAQALRTESPITPALQTRLQQQARLVHAVLGLQTEAGELADPVKKHIYYGRSLDPVNLREEIGDCLWYLAIAADALGTTLEAEQARNLAKLRTRYPHVFTAEAAQVRDLDRERQVLEGNDIGTLGQQSQRAVSDAFSEVNSLRQQLSAAQAEIETLRQQLANAQRELSEQGQSHSVELQQETADLRQQLDAARATVTLQRAGIERLQAQLAENEQARQLQAAEIERFDACIEKIKDHWAETGMNVRAAIEELEFGPPQPAPVAEPTPCPECKRLRAVIQTARRRLGQYVMWANPNDLRAALMELDANLSGLLTSSPTPVAEPIDGEGGQ